MIVIGCLKDLQSEREMNQSYIQIYESEFKYSKLMHFQIS
uniref:Uncharacterized protein n=1 Tax=Lepeophtheirus salmonis TaxID=72036 RepID=A0A0K2V7J7_LEPSM